MMNRLSIGIGIFWWTLGAAVSSALSQDDPPEKDDEEKEDPEEPEASEREIKVLALFKATKARFEKGRLVLTYNFETKDYDLVQDWSPSPEETKKRIRWSGKEGPL